MRRPLPLRRPLEPTNCSLWIPRANRSVNQLPCCERSRVIQRPRVVPSVHEGGSLLGNDSSTASSTSASVIGCGGSWSSGVGGVAVWDPGFCASSCRGTFCRLAMVLANAHFMPDLPVPFFGAGGGRHSRLPTKLAERRRAQLAKATEDFAEVICIRKTTGAGDSLERHPCFDEHVGRFLDANLGGKVCRRHPGPLPKEVAEMAAAHAELGRESADLDGFGQFRFDVGANFIDQSLVLRNTVKRPLRPPLECQSEFDQGHFHFQLVAEVLLDSTAYETHKAAPKNAIRRQIEQGPGNCRSLRKPCLQIGMTDGDPGKGPSRRLFGQVEAMLRWSAQEDQRPGRHLLRLGSLACELAPPRQGKLQADSGALGLAANSLVERVAIRTESGL